MSSDEIVLCWVQHMEWLQYDCDYDHAKELDRILWNWLEICNPMILWQPRYYTYKYKGVSQSTILQYLNTRLAMYLNLMDTHEADKTIKVFDHVIKGRHPYDQFMIYQLILRAEYFMRRGRYDESKKILNDLILIVKDPLALSHIYILLNTISNYGHVVMLGVVPDITYLTSALGYAEEADNYKAISSTYCQLGEAFQGTYPALAISMNRQAQVLADRNVDTYQATIAKLQRVYCEIMMLFRYDKKINADLFRKDAEKTLSAIKRESLPSDSLKAFYDEACGYVFGEDEPMYNALDFFERHNAYGEVYKLSEQLAGKALMKHDDDELKRLINKQRNAAIKMRDPMRLKIVDDFIKDYFK